MNNFVSLYQGKSEILQHHLYYKWAKEKIVLQDK
jgi:hypothetical protein